MKKEKQYRRKGNKLVSALTAMVMTAGLLVGVPTESMESVQAEEGVTLHNPQIQAAVQEWDSSMGRHPNLQIRGQMRMAL